MNLRDLGYLIALDEHRHFGRAAEACFVTQPTLSIQIRKLEDELGVTLVERSSRRLLFTAAGERIVAHARRALDEVAQIKAVADTCRDPESGALRLGFFPTLGAYLLPHVIGGIRARFPRLELLLTEDKTLDLIDRLADGRLDAALLATPVAEDALHGEALFEEPFVLAAPDTHALARRRSIRLADLKDQRLLLLEDGHCLRDQALEVCQLSGASERQDFRATSLETVRQMVAAGVGITLLPVLAVQAPVSSPAGLRLVPFAAPAPSRHIALFWRKHSPRHDLLMELARLIRQIPPELLDPATLAAAG